MTPKKDTTTKETYAADFEISLPSHTVFALFKASMLWVSADECRPHLRQLHFEGNGQAIALVTTNGHGLWMCEELCERKPHRPFEFDLRLADAKAVLKLIDRKRPTPKPKRRHVFSKPATPAAEELVTIKRKAGKATVCVGRFTFDVVAHPFDVFPPYKQVIALKQSSYSDHVGIAARYLGLVSKSLPGRRTSYGSGDEVVCRVGDKLDPCSFDGLVGELKARVIVMPVRV